MPLIECPDCGHQVSDAAPACIHCGRPLKPVLTAESEATRTHSPVVLTSAPGETARPPQGAATANELVQHATGTTYELFLYPHLIVIRHRDAAKLLGAKGDWHLDLASVAAVQYKPAGDSVGYIRFSIRGRNERGAGVLDDKMLAFEADQEKAFLGVRDFVEARIGWPDGATTQSAPMGLAHERDGAAVEPVSLQGGSSAPQPTPGASRPRGAAAGSSNRTLLSTDVGSWWRSLTAGRKALIVLGGLLGVMLVVVAIAANQEAGGRAAENSSASAPPDLEIAGSLEFLHLPEFGDQLTVVGMLRNNTPKYLLDVEITFNLYGRDGKLVGDAVARGHDLDRYGRWNFAAISNLPPHVVPFSVRLVSITGLTSTGDSLHQSINEQSWLKVQ